MKFIFVITYIGFSTVNSFSLEGGLDGRIVGGQNTSIAKYGYQVSVQGSNRHFCGGSIINNYWVVTAAHCINKKFVYTIRVGTSLLGQRGYVHQVAQIITHPDYGKVTPVDMDIALIKVRRPFRLNNRTVKAVKVADVGQGMPSGAIATITGWGDLSEGGADPEYLQVVKIPIIEWSECKDMYAKKGIPVTENMFCAGVPEGGKDSCQGDSGGPLVDSRGVLQGIVSWGIGCARPNTPGVYTKIASEPIRKFIKSCSGI